MRTLKGKILSVTTAVIILAFISCWFLMNSLLKDRMIAEAKKELSSQAFLSSMLLESSSKNKDEFITDLARELRCRISLIDLNGKVLIDSDTPAARLDNHKLRPEIKKALIDGTATDVRYSRSIGTYMVYSARRSGTGKDVQILRLAYRLSSLKEARKGALLRLLVLLVVAAAAALGIEYLVVIRFFSPLERIAKAAERITEGKKVQFPIMKDRELRKLSEALDEMYHKLNHALDELKEERKDLRTLISSMPIGLILLNKDKEIRMANNTARNLLLKERSSLPGELDSLIDQALETEEECSLDLSMPEQNIHLKTTVKLIETGILLVIQNLTEEYRLAEARRNFIADAGHEFQTPLTSIGITAEYLIEAGGRDDQTDKYLFSILNQQKRLTSLVDDLLFLSRLESEPPVAVSKSYDLAAILRKLISGQRGHPLSQNIKISTSIPEKAISWGDPEDIERAIDNVIGNAVKYVYKKFQKEPGGEIAISLERDEKEWTLTIADNGMGIKEKLAKSIFERFNRGDISRTRQDWGQGGYGLGLAIAKKILEDQSGKINLIKFTGGATFQISLPAEKT